MVLSTPMTRSIRPSYTGRRTCELSTASRTASPTVQRFSTAFTSISGTITL
jgi:hypothetical protein